MSYTEENIEVFSHATATGSIPCAMLKPRAAFERKTTLPLTWKRVRLAVLYSVRGLAGKDAPPVPETAYNLQGRAEGTYLFGLTNGAGFPGQSGVRFMGIATDIARTDENPSIVVDQINSKVHTFSAPNGCFSFVGMDGGAYNSAGNLSPDVYFNPTLGTAEFMAGLVLEMTPGWDTWGGCSYISFSVGGLPSLSANSSHEVGGLLERLLGTTGLSGSGGCAAMWWNGGTVPTGLTTLFFRLPYNNNRLVVHGYQTALLA